MCLLNHLNGVEGTKDGFIAIKGGAAFESGRQVGTLCRHLEGVNKRHLGVTSSQRLQNTLCLIAQPEHEADRASVSPRAGSSSEGGTPVAAGEGSRNPHVRQSGGLLLKPLPGTQEEWSNKTSDQPEAVEPMGVCRTLQNGGNPYPNRPPETRRLVCEGGPKGRLLHSPHRPWPPAIPEVRAGQGELPVHMPPLRPFLCPRTFNKVMKPVMKPVMIFRGHGGQDNYLVSTIG